MNREIKFRVWTWNSDIRKGQWIEWSRSILWGATNINEIFTQNNHVFQQFTGLRDKNGKDVYEGDILIDDFTGKKYEVCWDFGDGAWICSDIVSDCNQFPIWKELNSMCVFGNVFETEYLK